MTTVLRAITDPAVWDNGWSLLPARVLVAARRRRQSALESTRCPPTSTPSRAFAGDVHAPWMVAGCLRSNRQERWAWRLGGAVNDMLALDRFFRGLDDDNYSTCSTANGSINWRWRTGGDAIGVPIGRDEHRVYFSCRRTTSVRA